MPRRVPIVVTLLLALCGGCATAGGAGNRPKTLLSWNGGKAADEEKAGEDGKDEKDGTAKEPEPLKSDRPDFTEASSTVGAGRVQLESGYTFSHNRDGGVATAGHSFPEALLRVGLFADWFELRLGQNLTGTRTTGPGRAGDVPPDGPPTGSPPGAPRAAESSATGRLTGFEDLYVGAKLGLTEQAGARPESALILQATVPTGRRGLTAGKVLPGMSYLFSWDVVPDRLAVGGSSIANAAVDDDAHTYLELAQSVTAGYDLTKRLGAYVEGFAFFPAGATAPGVGPQYYFDGGFTYKLTPDFQLDIRAGVGLNRHADDYFVGTGFAARY